MNSERSDFLLVIDKILHAACAVAAGRKRDAIIPLSTAGALIAGISKRIEAEVRENAT